MLIRPLLGTIARLLLLSLVVGLLLSFFGLSPLGLFAEMGARLRELTKAVPDLVHWAVPYVLLGAEIVVPVAIIAALLRLRRR